MISYSHVKLLPSSPVSLPKTFLLLLIITVTAAVSAGFAQAQSKDDLQALIRASKTRAALYRMFSKLSCTSRLRRRLQTLAEIRE